MSDKELTVHEGAVVPFQQMERMALAVSKSGMFAVKTPEAALTLLLIAQSEGIHPAQALMDYDVIGGKPALKSAAMLARYQRSGGKVKWLQASDSCVEGTFSHPSCDGPVTVRWDNERIGKAGLDDRDMHKKFGQQMKRARCITEGIRATAPQSIPLGLYSTEETHDMIDVTPAPVSENAAIAAVSQRTAMPEEERDEHFAKMDAALDVNTLMHAYQTAVRACRATKDDLAEHAMQQVYQGKKAEIEAASQKQLDAAVEESRARDAASGDAV